MFRPRRLTVIYGLVLLCAIQTAGQTGIATPWDFDATSRLDSIMTVHIGTAKKDHDP